ncbi:hypothetical protein KM043_004549 [Ampulex compressa]|nr:hypothetical protein KM043_004549 [Ampulex compressa]
MDRDKLKAAAVGGMAGAGGGRVKEEGPRDGENFKTGESIRALLAGDGAEGGSEVGADREEDVEIGISVEGVAIETSRSSRCGEFEGMPLAYDRVNALGLGSWGDARDILAWHTRPLTVEDISTGGANKSAANEK